MAFRFHARRKIPQRFFPPSQIHPARCRAKAALLNSSSTPSNEITSHVIIIGSRAPTQRAKSEFEVLRSNSTPSQNIEEIFVVFSRAAFNFIQVASRQISIVHFANSKKHRSTKGPQMVAFNNNYNSISFV